jgi:hypothetical protein
MFLNTLFALLVVSSQAQTQVIPFDSDRWEIRGQESKLVDYLGRPSLFIKGGMAVVKDSEFKNGTIEFEIAFSGERGFMGAVWRIYEPNNFEEFYMRPHQSGNPDANQYTPIFNGSSAWQLYHGDGYGAPTEYFFNEWMRVKIVVSGGRGEVYIKNMEKPAVVIHEMKHGVKSGRVGLMCSNFAPAYFSNFEYQPMDNPKLQSAPKHAESVSEGTITSWSVSSAFDEKSLEDKYRVIGSDQKELSWTMLKSEATGITNLARVQGPAQEKNAVFAKLTIDSENEQTKSLKFGYSDRVKVYFNGQLIYSGSNLYQTRDYRYLGTIGYFDEVHWPLRKGENELWLAVDESFGGWGIQAMFEDMTGIELRNNL